MDREFQQIKSRIESANNILVTSHFRPDGDAIGSVIAFGLALIDAGKNTQMVIANGVPSNFSFLTGSEKISSSIKNDYDVSIILDCSELHRVGFDFDNEFVPTINIDHHITNNKFAEINIVQHTVPATTEILAELLPKIGLNISVPVAEALLTGLLTDTLGFRTCNVHPKTLCIAADLMEKGADLQTLYQHSLMDRSYKALKYWAAGLSTLQLENNVLWATLTLEDRKKTGYPGRDDADLINVLSSTNEVDVAIIFVEQPNGKVKVSWRANRGIDVSKIAASFGGGGHKPAAGADIIGNLETIQPNVIKRTKEYLKRLHEEGNIQ